MHNYKRATSPMMLSVDKSCIVIPPMKHSATLFMFHDSGKSGEDFKQEMKFYNNSEELKFPHIKIIYPTAPIPVNVLRGQFPSWFDRDLYVHESPEAKHSIDIMCNKVSELIHKEVAHGIPLNRIAVAGFSRGGRLAMHLAYRFKRGLAGCIVMSSCLNSNSLVYESLKSESKIEDCPELLMLHGDQDHRIPLDLASNTFKQLQSLGVKGCFIKVPRLGHGMCPNEISYVRNWVQKRLK